MKTLNENIAGHLVFWSFVAFICFIIFVFAPMQKEETLTKSFKEKFRTDEVSYEYLGKNGSKPREDKYLGDSVFHFKNPIGAYSLYRVETKDKRYLVSVDRKNLVVQSVDTSNGEKEAFEYFNLK